MADDNQRSAADILPEDGFSRRSRIIRGQESDNTEDEGAIRPSYSALLLSNTTTEELMDSDLAADVERLQPNIHHSIMERLEQYEASVGRQELHRSSSEETVYIPIMQTTPARDTRLHEDLSSADQNGSTVDGASTPRLVWPRQTWRYNSRGRRAIDPNDSSTLLGMRVAAREASSLNTAQNVQQHRSFWDHLVQTVPDARSRSISPFESPANAVPARFPTDHGPRTQTSQTASVSQSHNGLHPALGEFRREQASHTVVPEISTNRQDRAIFDAPLPPGTVLVSDPTRPWSPYERLSQTDTSNRDSRSYVVRRRFNADGEEHVHSITMGDGESSDSTATDEPISSSLRPTIYHTYLRTRLASRDSSRTSTDVIPTPAPPLARRRGWARLDANGNEISVEEEEELERLRTQDRLRAQWRSNVLAGREQGAAWRAAGRENLVPVTRTSIFLGPEDGSVARVRLNSFASESRERNMSGSTYAPSDAGPDVCSSLAPFYVNPLPMPLPSVTRAQPVPVEPIRIVRVSRLASLAGR